MFKRAFAGLLISTALSSAALATNGYFDIGYSVKSKGMGGVGVAFPQDSLAAASNPAGMVTLGNRADLGVTFFQPDRDAELGPMEFDGNDTDFFLVPEAGFNRMVDKNVSFGLSIFGNGGMNTDYTTAIPAFGTTPAGVNLEQMFIAPSMAFRVKENHSFGIAPIIAYQSFKAHGLENFGIANAGDDSSFGGGVRIGYMGQINEYVTVGASYQTRMLMSKFDKYRNLFAEHGEFDIPSTWDVGVAVHPNQRLVIAFDIQRINYSEVNAVGNPLTMARMGNGLGSNEGPGFGWEDMWVYKIGVAYDVSKNWTVRCGYNYGSQPIPADQTLFNMLAPGVVEHHATLGFTWKINDKFELSADYVHAFFKKVEGANNFNNGNADLQMFENSLGVSLCWKY